MTNRFIIGIGSQRAGSTLLHRLLNTSTNIFMHPVKELHYFDTLNGIRSQKALKEYSLRQIYREINRIVDSSNFDFIDKKYKCYIRTNQLLSKNIIHNVNYLDLFRPFLSISKFLGEVTPEYMLLNQTSIDKMRDIVGKDALIILICRNPTKRLFSAVKLMNAYNNMNMNSKEADSWLNEMIDGQSSWMVAQDRYNDYATAISRFSKAFSSFIAISYDDLITKPDNVIKKLESTCKISIDHDSFKAGLKKVSNALGTSFSFKENTIQKITKRYEPNKNFLNSYFHDDLNR